MGCDSTVGTDDANEAQMEVLLTNESNAISKATHTSDQESEIDRAEVTIQRVELVGDEGPPMTLADSEDLSDNEEHDGLRINLLDLQGGLTETLADVNIPAGTYHQIRLIVGTDPHIELTDGSSPNLKVPSGEQTGIKIVTGEFTVEQGQFVSVTLDFNPDDSFVRAGQSGMYLFKPTVRASEVSVDGDADDLFSWSGQVGDVNASERTLTIDGVSFDVFRNANVEDATGEEVTETTLDALSADDYVETDGTRIDDDDRMIREIRIVEGEERSVHATVDEVTEDELSVLGANFVVADEDNGFELSGFDSIDDIDSGDRILLEYDYVVDEEDDGQRVAVRIEDADA